MKLTNSFFLLSISSLILILIGYGLSSIYIQSQMNDVYSSRKNNNYMAVSAAVKNISTLHVNFARDYSLWDDMVTAVQTKNVEWLEHEFYGPLEIYKADGVWIADRDGAIIYHQDAEELKSAGTILKLPIDVEKITATSNSEQVTTFFDYDAQKRLVAYHVGPILYHSKPALNTKPYGFIIIGVVWDERLLAPLTDLVQGKITTSPHIAGEIHNETTNSLVFSLPSFENKKIADLDITFRDNSLQKMSFILLNQAKQTMIIGIFCILVCLALFKISVIKPIQKLVAKLESSGTTCSITDKNCSEIGLLSALIDSHTEQGKKLEEKNELYKKKSHELSAALDDLKTSEEKLKKELHTTLKLSKIVEFTTDAIVITNKDGKIEYVNQAWQNLNGYTFDEVVGKNPRVLKSGETNTSVYHHMWGLLNNNEPFKSEDVINRRKDGSFYAARISVFPVVQDNKKTNYVGICQDITKQKEREALNSQFISLASHQLRTPLTTLRWFAELLNKKVKKLLPTKEAEMLKDIEVNAIRMTELVNRLLNLSRIESGRIIIHPQVLNFKKCAEEIKKDLQPILERKKQSLHISQECKYSHVLVDTELLHEVFLNLIINASKYSPDESKIEVRIYGQNGRVYFSVKDSGIGIPQNEQTLLFQRFFRASNAINHQIQGTGLGLYLVKVIIKQLDGEISISSAVNKGTTVEFYIPKDGVKKEGDQKLVPTSKEHI